MGIKIHEQVEHDGKTHRAWIFHCPGCDAPHQCDGRWSFNGSLERPTFGPVSPAPNCSILVDGFVWGDASKGEPEQIKRRCHSHVKDGRITFTKAPDTTHPLAGQSVEIPDWDTRSPRPRSG